MKRMIQYLSRQIVSVGVTTLFPGTKNDVMLSIETDKQEMVFRLEHEQAKSLGLKMIEKAIPDKETRFNYLRAIMGDR